MGKSWSDIVLQLLPFKPDNKNVVHCTHQQFVHNSEKIFPMTFFLFLTARRFVVVLVLVLAGTFCFQISQLFEPLKNAWTSTNRCFQRKMSPISISCKCSKTISKTISCKSSVGTIWISKITPSHIDVITSIFALVTMLAMKKRKSEEDILNLQDSSQDWSIFFWDAHLYLDTFAP